MNYDAMTCREMIHYLDLYSTDPVVRKLVQYFAGEGLITELEEAGMDPATQTFTEDHDVMDPGEYIESLRRRLRYAEDDLSDLQFKYEQVVEERDELKTRSIMDFVEEVWQEKRTAGYKVAEALKEAEQQRQENARLREQIDMWGRMNQVKVTV